MRSARNGSISANSRRSKGEELLVAFQQIGQFRAHLLLASGEQHPQILDRGTRHAIIEIDEMRPEIGPENVAAMAVAQDAPLRGAAPAERALLDGLEERVGEIGVLGRQIVRHPLALEQKIARPAPQILDAEARPFMELARAPHRVNAAEKAPDPFPLLGGAELGPAPPASRKDGIAKPAVQMQRLPVGR